MLLSPACVDVGNLHVGDQLFRRYEVRDEDGVLTNSAVSGSIDLPDGTTANLNVANEGTGLYLVTFAPFTMSGYHSWTITSAGPVYKVDKGRLHVKP
jgi:hypothetical protein